MAAAHAHSLAAGERERGREGGREEEREREVLLLNNPPSSLSTLPGPPSSRPMPDTLASPGSITSP